MSLLLLFNLTTPGAPSPVERWTSSTDTRWSTDDMTRWIQRPDEED